MADILSPTGIEKPLGGELHSRAQYLRNLDRANQIAIDQVTKAGGLKAEVISNTADATGQVAHVVLQNIASFTFLANRKYRLKFIGNCYTTNADTAVFFRLATCSTADSASAVTGLTTRNTTNSQFSVTGRAFNAGFEAPFTTGADSTLQVKITAERVAGTGSFALQRSGIAPNYLQIIDEGAQF